MERFYRRQFKTRGMHSFRLEMMESDLFVVCDADVKNTAEDALKKARGLIEDYVNKFPVFKDSLKPLDVSSDAPEIVKKMTAAARVYEVGPMAAVAGAVADYVGNAVSNLCSHIIIENGGDIFLKSEKPITLGVFAGEDSPFKDRLRFKIESRGMPLGICTSSGKIGHSLSFGNADAVMTIAKDPATADAAATALANKIKTVEDVQQVLDAESQRRILSAMVIVIEDKMGVWGDVELI